MFGELRRCITAIAAQTYASIELGSTQAKFLRHIGRHSLMSQAELARATGTDPTLTGRVLQTLIDRGLVLRQRSDEDRRVYVLELSAAGRRAQERVEKLRAQVAARIVASLDERDFEDFERIRNKILAALEPTAPRRDQ
jgi:DNA-binding MarR family transcriptional regulator